MRQFSISAYLKTATVLSLGGVLFAGYLSAYRLLSGTCAFKEPCPFFLGYPACWYGLAMFLSLFIISVIGLTKTEKGEWAVRANAAVSMLGVIFSGYFVVDEITRWLRFGIGRYALGLSTCVYGFVFFVIIFVISVRAWRMASKKADDELNKF